jgi:hypothetical protein
MQRCPVAQAAAAPQRQDPVDEQLSARVSHAAQVEPASPQVASDRIAQVVPWQQPLGHDVASQMHSPDAQRWPPAHGGPSPHAHAPAAQRSALLTSQVLQAAPGDPQVASDTGLHTFPWQHPAAHEDASQTQAPFMQRCPAAHGAPPPHRQAPVTEQVSARSASQLPHAAAPMPQVSSDRG